MSEYRTVAGPATAEIVVKKSRFIGQVRPVASSEEAAAFVAQVKREHREATHNCYAWIVDALNQRSSDDGEPAGTAGRPMLAVLRQEELQGVAVVVTRYFGGIMLGANGLVRAYSQATKRALAAAGMGRQVPFRKLMAQVDYSLYARLESRLREGDWTVLDTEFAEAVTITLGMPRDKVDQAMAWLRQFSNGQARLEPGQEYYQFIRGK